MSVRLVCVSLLVLALTVSAMDSPGGSKPGSPSGSPRGSLRGSGRPSSTASLSLGQAATGVTSVTGVGTTDGDDGSLLPRALTKRQQRMLEGGVAPNNRRSVPKSVTALHQEKRREKQQKDWLLFSVEEALAELKKMQEEENAEVAQQDTIQQAACLNPSTATPSEDTAQRVETGVGVPRRQLLKLRKLQSQRVDNRAEQGLQRFETLKREKAQGRKIKRISDPPTEKEQKGLMRVPKLLAEVYASEKVFAEQLALGCNFLTQLAERDKKVSTLRKAAKIFSSKAVRKSLKSFLSDVCTLQKVSEGYILKVEAFANLEGKDVATLMDATVGLGKQTEKFLSTTRDLWVSTIRKSTVILDLGCNNEEMKAFNEYFAEVNPQKPNSPLVTLNSVTGQPMQRIMRYPFLFEEAVHFFDPAYVKEEGDDPKKGELSDYASDDQVGFLKEAFSRISRITLEINKAVDDDEPLTPSPITTTTTDPVLPSAPQQRQQEKAPSPSSGGKLSSSGSSPSLLPTAPAMSSEQEAEWLRMMSNVEQKARDRLEKKIDLEVVMSQQLAGGEEKKDKREKEQKKEEKKEDKERKPSTGAADSSVGEDDLEAYKGSRRSLRPDGRVSRTRPPQNRHTVHVQDLWKQAEGQEDEKKEEKK